MRILKHYLNVGSLWLLLLMAVMAIVSCGDEEEGRIKINDAAPAQVSDLKASETPGGVILSWMNPTDSSFMYSKVVYTNAKGEETYQLFSKERATDGKMTVTISGFATTTPVKFQVYACSVRGNNQGAVEIEATPGAPNFVKVLKTVSIEPSFGGVVVSYDNQYDENVVVVLDYQGATTQDAKGTAQFTAAKKTKGSQFVRFAYNNNKSFLSGEAVKITYHTEDEYENASETQEVSVTPQGIVALDRSGWTFPGYDPNSNSAQIGYSSQETKGEGKNGRLMAILDGDFSTYWHSSWKVKTDYPQWFIVDMGAEHEIVTLDFARRLNNNKEQKGEHIYTCTDANAADKSNPESWTWEDQGSYSFDPNSDALQPATFKKAVKARYIKVYFGKEFKGNGNFCMLSEMNAYVIK